MKLTQYLTLLLIICLFVSVLSVEIVDAIVTSIVKGDINADGLIDNLDAAYILRYDAGLIELNEAELLAGDCNGDGLTDNIDAVCVLRYDAGLISNVTRPGSTPIYPSKKNTKSP